MNFLMKSLILILQKLRFYALVIGLITLKTQPLGAEEIREFYNGIRGLGMGGAAVATVNDETAVLVNPAGLGKLRDSFFTVFDPELSMGADTQAIIGYDVMAAFDPQAVLDLLNEGHRGKHFHQSIQAFPSFVVPNFAIGVYGKYSTDAELNEAGTLYSLDYTNDYAAVLGYNFRLWGGRIKLGFNTRIVNRIEIHQDLPANSTGLKISSLAKEGTGVASDVGLILTAPWDWLPTLAAVYRDVGNTTYNIQDGMFLDTAERPDVTEAKLDAAFALFPILSNRTRMTITGEYRDVLNASEHENAQDYIHAGLEVNVADIFFVRGGMNQKHWTAGFELSLFNYQLQIASYGENVGTKADPKDDRRYVAKFAYRF